MKEEFKILDQEKGTMRLLYVLRYELPYQPKTELTRYMQSLCARALLSVGSHK